MKGCVVCLDDLVVIMMHLEFRHAGIAPRAAEADGGGLPLNEIDEASLVGGGRGRQIERAA